MSKPTRLKRSPRDSLKLVWAPLSSRLSQLLNNRGAGLLCCRSWSK
jgi:hypothetical protein